MIKIRHRETKPHLGALAVIAAVIAATGSLGAASSYLAKRTVVWDGEIQKTGAGWVNPTTSSIKPQSAVVHGGNVALEFKFNDTAHWIGAGWNWLGFKTGSIGADVRAMKRFTFWIKSNGKTCDLQLNLLCNGRVADTPEHHTDKVHLLKYCPKLFDAEWHEVAIPLADLKRPAGFDARHVCEMQLGFLADKAASGSFYFADLAFDDRG